MDDDSENLEADGQTEIQTESKRWTSLDDSHKGFVESINEAWMTRAVG